MTHRVATVDFSALSVDCMDCPWTGSVPSTGFRVIDEQALADEWSRHRGPQGTHSGTLGPAGAIAMGTMRRAVRL